MRTALYARVSTVDQNCAGQLEELRRYVAARGWLVVGEYVDTGVSGGKASRPELDRLMADVHRRRFEVVAVTKIDRFGRSVLHLTRGLRELEDCGIRFLAVQQGIDTDASNPTSRLLLHILAAVAEFERELIRERVTAGQRRAMAAGIRCGCPPRLPDDAILGMAEVSIRKVMQKFGIKFGEARSLIARGRRKGTK